MLVFFVLFFGTDYTIIHFIDIYMQFISIRFSNKRPRQYAANKLNSEIKLNFFVLLFVLTKIQFAQFTIHAHG